MAKLKRASKAKIIAAFIGLLVIVGIFLYVFVPRGQQVTVTAINKITQAPIEKAKVRIGDATATTNEKGVATLFLLTTQQEVNETLNVDGFNAITTTIKVSKGTDANKLTLTPTGKVFYMDKQSGRFDVKSVNLDGTNQKTVLKGTGNEQGDTNALLSSTDWKYLALQSKRDATKKEEGQLYFVDANSGKVTTAENTNNDIQLVGWVDHKFIYTVTKILPLWQPGHYELKSYDAESGKVATLESTAAHGTNDADSQFETIPTAFIVAGKVVYAKNWNLGSLYSASANQKVNDTKLSISSINADGSDKQTLKEFSFKHTDNIASQGYGPREVYFKIALDTEAPQYFEYEEGALQSAKDAEKYFDDYSYPTYLISPSEQKTFWFENSEGKDNFYVGDDEGGSKKSLGDLAGYIAYGWYSDDYVLLSKGDNELYIASASKPFSEVPPVKLTNYHKSALTFPSYGSGYGGA